MNEGRIKDEVLFLFIAKGSMHLLHGVFTYAKKHIEITTHKQYRVTPETNDDVMQAVDLALKKHEGPAVFFLEKDLAMSLRAGASLVRENPRTPIEESELENLIGKALWKIYTKHRTAAAKQIGRSEVEVMLGYGRVMEVKLDGHRVINPIGFSPRTVEVWCEETIAAQEVHAYIEQCSNEEGEVIMLEPRTHRAGLPYEIMETPTYIYADVAKTDTALYYTENGKSKRVDMIDWGYASLEDRIAEAFAVTQKEAYEIRKRLQQNELSDKVARAVTDIIEGEVATLAHAVDIQSKKYDVKDVYVYSSVPLPAVLYSTKLKRRLKYGYNPQKIDTRCISEKTKITLQLRRTSELPQNARLDILSAVRLLSTDRGALQKMTNRRVRWMHAQ